MPRFVPSGPDLPVDLLRSQKEGRLAFFCGAGLSKLRAGLPRGSELVQSLQERLGAEKPLPEDASLEQSFSTMEARHGRQRVRTVLRDILTAPDDTDLEAHRLVLELSKGRAGFPRVATTNFDDLFERCGERLSVRWYPGAVPPDSQLWHGLAYLHGSLAHSGPDLNDLVLTEDDFKDAYIRRDGSPGRALDGLLRHFDVLFLGYSAGDTFVQYLLEVVEVARRRGENYGRCWIILPFERDDRMSALTSIGVTTIPYRPGHDHASLFETLLAWQDHRERGIEHSIERVLHITDNEDPTNPDNRRQLAWLLAEEAAVTKAWADHTPIPAFEWFEAIEKAPELGAGQLLAADSGVSAPPLADRGWLTARPAPLARTSFHVGRWLIRHLCESQANDDGMRALHWIVRQGGHLHPELRQDLRRRLRSSELSGLHRALAAALASEWYARLLSQRGVSYVPDLEESENVSGLSAPQRLDLGELLRPLPVFQLREMSFEPWGRLPKATSIRHAAEQRPSEGPDRADVQSTESARAPSGDRWHYIDWELELAGGTETRFLLEKLRSGPAYPGLLAPLLVLLTQYLCEAIEWLVVIDDQSTDEDPSRFWRAFIAPHSEDEDRARYHSWLLLIDFLRDGLVHLGSSDPEKAQATASWWLTLDNALFERLVVHAGAEAEGLRPVVCRWLLEHRDSLWRFPVRREVLRFLRRARAGLTADELEALCQLILGGPPEGELAGYDQQDRTAVAERAILHRLEELEESGCDLPEAATSRLADLRDRHGSRVAADHSDELAFRTSTGWLDIEESGAELARSSPREAARVLNEAAERGSTRVLHFDWPGAVQRDPARAFAVMDAALDLGGPDPQVLHRFLNSLPLVEEADGERVVKPDLMAKLLALLERCDDDLFASVLGSIAGHLRALGQALPEGSNPPFFRSWDRAWAIASGKDDDEDAGEGFLADDSSGDVLTRALNRPGGELAQALLAPLWRVSRTVGSRLPEATRQRIQLVLESTGPAGHLGRVMLLTDLWRLHLLDPDWVEDRLLDLLDWCSANASDHWEGLVAGGTLTLNLLSPIKTRFLQAFSHTPHLQRHSRDRLCDWLASISLEHPGTLSEDEIQQAVSAVQPEDLPALLVGARSILDRAADQAEAWRTRVEPWLKGVWPRDASKRSARETEQFVWLCLYVEDAFPNAVAFVRNFMSPNGRTHTLYPLSHSTLADRFPDAMLDLLARLLPDDHHDVDPWNAHELQELIDQIAAANAELHTDPRFVRLRDLQLRLSS